MILVRPNRCCQDPLCHRLQIPAARCLFSWNKIATKSAPLNIRKEYKVLDSVFIGPAAGDCDLSEEKKPEKQDSFHRVDKLYVSKSGMVDIFFSFFCWVDSRTQHWAIDKTIHHPFVFFRTGIILHISAPKKQGEKEKDSR